MVLFVAHINKAQRIGGYAPRIIEFAIGDALWAKGPQKASLRVEYLYAVVISANTKFEIIEIFK